MKKLTVLLATLFVFHTGDAQQILSGIYSGSMYNDTTKMLQKYELALSEYRGKVMGYSYVTFVVNDTFYYGIRRVKGYKNDKNELVLTDEELLANNFPESPAKRVRRTAIFPLAQEDTITSLSGTWQTNRTRQFYSVGGATKTERSLDSSQSPLVSHLKELDIISSGPTYRDDAVVKSKPKKEEKKPKETDVAKRNERKDREESKPVVQQPDTKTVTPGVDKNTLAGANAPKQGNNGTVVNRKDSVADKAVAVTSDNNTTKPGTGDTEAGNNTQPVGDKKNTDTKKDGNVAVTGEAGRTTTTGNQETAKNTNDNNPDKQDSNNTAALGVKNQAADITGKPTTRAVDNTANKLGQNVSAPVNNSTTDAGKVADKKAGEGNKVGAQPSGTASKSGAKPEDKSVVSDETAKANDNNVTGKTKDTGIKQADQGKTTPEKVVTQKNDVVTGVSSTTAEKDNKGTTDNNATARNTDNEVKKDAVTGSEVNRNEKTTAPAATTPEGRTSAVITTLNVVNDSITLSFYDNGVVDGDVISVFVNGQNIVASVRLNEVAMKKTIHLTNFAADSVEVTLVAETLGSIPPNTGLVLVYDGDKRYDVRFSADMKTNASIVFRKAKK
jgi:hypothetical protein